MTSVIFLCIPPSRTLFPFSPFSHTPPFFQQTLKLVLPDLHAPQWGKKACACVPVGNFANEIICESW